MIKVGEQIALEDIKIGMRVRGRRVWAGGSTVHKLKISQSLSKGSPYLMTEGITIYAAETDWTLLALPKREPGPIDFDAIEVGDRVEARKYTRQGGTSVFYFTIEYKDECSVDGGGFHLTRADLYHWTLLEAEAERCGATTEIEFDDYVCGHPAGHIGFHGQGEVSW